MVQQSLKETTKSEEVLALSEELKEDVEDAISEWKNSTTILKNCKTFSTKWESSTKQEKPERKTEKC